MPSERRAKPQPSNPFTSGLTEPSPFYAGNPRKADQAYSQLKHLILSLQLKPGQSLDERELMQQLGIGRTPMREAIQRLAHERLIKVEPRRGSWVTDLSITELQDMLTARQLVEPVVAAMAARRITDSQIDQLSELADARNVAIDRDQISEAVYLDREFHRTLAEASGNSFLAAIVDQVNTSMLRYWHVSFQSGGDLRSSAGRHQQLLDCVKERDAAATVTAMREHISNFRRRMGKAIGLQQHEDDLDLDELFE